MTTRGIERKFTNAEERRLHKAFELSRLRDRLFAQQEPKLKRLYPDQWVAFSSTGLVAHSKSRSYALRKARETSDPSTMIRLLSTKKRHLIL